MENKNIPDKNSEPLVLDMFNRFSSGIQIDKYNRMWVRTLIREPTIDERITIAIIQNDMVPYIESNLLKFEIFDEKGILLGNYETEIAKNAFGFRIFEDILFIADTSYTMAVYEHRIIEK